MFNKRAPGTQRRALPRAAALLVVTLLASGGLQAQDKAELQNILQRLDRLEQENHELIEEVHALRTELAARSQPAAGQQPTTGQSAQAQQAQTATAAPLPERVQVVEQRVDDLSQEKVEASQRFPVSLTGMMLFNSFLNGNSTGGYEDPTFASATAGSAVNGATVAQTILGLRYQSPRALWGARVNGSVFFDFWGGEPGEPLGHWARLRTADIQLDWANTSVSVGQDKPLIAARDPFSLAQVQTSPFTDAGNLWLWSPQVRAEQRFKFGDSDSLRAQLSVYELEPSADGPNYSIHGEYGAAAALEGRFEYRHDFSDHIRVELAPGFHTAQTTENGYSIPSRLFSFDWFANPWEKIELSGAFYRGENIAGLGTIGPGYFFYDGVARPMQSIGGWAQMAWLATPKLTFHIIAGQDDNQRSEVHQGFIFKNEGYAANMIYRVAPNVLFSLEGMQLRTSYAGTGMRLNNHYDLGLAYLF